MPAGVAVILENGIAHITPGPGKRGEVLRALTGVTLMIDVDTSGDRKAYIVTESAAREAGLIDGPTEKAPAKKAPAKKTAPKPAPTAPDTGA